MSKRNVTNFSWVEWQYTILGNWCGIDYCENLFYLSKDEQIWFRLLVKAAEGEN